MRKLYAILFVSLFTYYANGQFQTLGNPATTVLQTIAPGYTEFRLTTTSPIEQAGAVWKTTQYNLATNFSFNASLYFGIYTETNPDLSKPKAQPGDPLYPYDYQTGADGIAFVMAPTPYLGAKGEEIGYGTTIHDPVDGTPGYTPNNSLAIEMDTWQNVFPAHDGWANHNDPDGNHIAMMSKGQATHGTAEELVAPISIVTGDLEDGNWHDVLVTWNAGTKTLTLTSTSGFSFSISKTFTQAQLDAIFGVGVTNINVGFTAATGTAANEHKVRWITPPTNCTPGYTITQGGWGAVARGNNPGTYLNNHFSTAFPLGVTVGLSGHSAKWTSATAVRIFLPAGGTSKVLPGGNLINPTSTSGGVVVGQVLALSLNVGFDAADPNFSSSSTPLSAMVIASGPFAGWTVGQFLTTANNVLGGASSLYTPDQINSTATAINENYDGGTEDNGFLVCPNGAQQSRMAPPDRNLTANAVDNNINVYPNPNKGQGQLNVGSIKNAEIQIVNSRGVIVERRLAGGAQTLSLNLRKYGTGIYIVKVISGSTVKTSKVLVQD